jgi:Calmodulin binding protein-like
MSDKMWEITVNHAKTCCAGEKVYVYGAQNMTVYLNSVCELLSVTIGGIPYALQDLPRNQKV